MDCNKKCSQAPHDIQRLGRDFYLCKCGVFFDANFKPFVDDNIQNIVPSMKKEDLDEIEKVVKNICHNTENCSFD